ncbi:DUF2285 domain-containing protein [Mesorhizobium shangrilense]|uniref:DUF2285 domain-containing protein n=1 Tax=Mesorhizobium shangrilense TaxID=460060 RepID=A0ABV2DLP6_9HYPH
MWTEQASPRVLRGTRLPASISPSPQTVDLLGLSTVSVWVRDEELQAVWPASASTHRLTAESRESSFGINAIVLPLDGSFETRLDAARRFWRELNCRPPGSPYGTLPIQTKARHIINLRAHDARRAGATYREIAQALLSREPIAPRDWRDHHLRHKVRAILRRADRLVAGGYRDLLFYPHSRCHKSDR